MGQKIPTNPGAAEAALFPHIQPTAEFVTAIPPGRIRDLPFIQINFGDKDHVYALAPQQAVALALQIAEALKVMRQVADALAAAENAPTIDSDPTGGTQ